MRFHNFHNLRRHQKFHDRFDKQVNYTFLMFILWSKLCVRIQTSQITITQLLKHLNPHYQTTLIPHNVASYGFRNHKFHITHFT